MKYKSYRYVPFDVNRTTNDGASMTSCGVPPKPGQDEPDKPE